MNNYYFTEKISNKKVAVPAKELVFPVQFERDENKQFVGFKFNDDVLETDKRKLVLQIGKCLECRVKKNTPRSKVKVIEEPVSKEPEPKEPDPKPELPAPIKKERMKKVVKEEVKEGVKEERNWSNKPPRKQRPRKEKKTE